MKAAVLYYLNLINGNLKILGKKVVARSTAIHSTPCLLYKRRETRSPLTEIKAVTADGDGWTDYGKERRPQLQGKSYKDLR